MEELNLSETTEEKYRVEWEEVSRCYELVGGEEVFGCYYRVANESKSVYSEYDVWWHL